MKNDTLFALYSKLIIKSLYKCKQMKFDVNITIYKNKR